MTEHFLGMRIHVNPMLDNVPRMTASRRTVELMPPEFVADLNAWMLEFFGTHSVAYLIADGSTVMGEQMYAQIKGMVE